VAVVDYRLTFTEIRYGDDGPVPFRGTADAVRTAVPGVTPVIVPVVCVA
jgi:hypothetical protein